MTTAIITCLQPGGAYLPDLNLRLKKGETFTLTKLKAQGSTDLTSAIKSGLVECQWKDTEPVAPSMTPPWLKKRVPVPQQTPEPVEPTSLSAEQVREVIQQEIQSALSGLVFPTQPAAAPQIDVDLLAAALVRAGVGSMGSGASMAQQAPTASTRGHMDPVFIPSSILPKNTSGTDSINVSATQTDSTGMDEAAAALKLSRGSRPKSGARRNPTPEE